MAPCAEETAVKRVKERFLGLICLLYISVDSSLTEHKSLMEWLQRKDELRDIICRVNDNGILDNIVDMV